MQKKKITERFYKRVSHNRSSTNDPPCSLNRDHGPIRVLSHRSMAVKIEENMNRQITLCWEHIVTIKFPNYKCILNKRNTLRNTLLPNDTLDQVDLN
jgi:hypothetical protein